MVRKNLTKMGKIKKKKENKQKGNSIVFICQPGNRCFTHSVIEILKGCFGKVL